MDSHIQIAPEPEETPDPALAAAKPCLIIREGRGRLGGTMFLDLLIQRAREESRRVKPLDGDLKSRTLTATYPAVGQDGEAIGDGASAPASDDIVTLKDWIQGHLNDMTEDRVSRVLDLSGGDRATLFKSRTGYLLAFEKLLGVARSCRNRHGCADRDRDVAADTAVISGRNPDTQKRAMLGRRLQEADIGADQIGRRRRNMDFHQNFGRLKRGNEIVEVELIETEGALAARPAEGHPRFERQKAGRRIG